MGLISTEVEVDVTSRVLYYENLGYVIPKYYNETNHTISVKRGTKIKVKVQDLSKGSGAVVQVKCDCCERTYEMQYYLYSKQNRQGKIYCHPCAMKLFNSGENNHSWDLNKTDEERIAHRKQAEYQKFIKSILARDNYTCRSCNQTGGDLEVHHLYGYAGYPEYRTDQTQAITLCKRCHKIFHSWHRQKYGYSESGKCTREQFEEWLKQPIPLLKCYSGELSTARQVYDLEENKVYNSAVEYAKLHNTSNTNVYNCCNHKETKATYKRKDGNITNYTTAVYTVKGHHLFWFDEYQTISKSKMQKYLQLCEPCAKNHPKSVICITIGKKFISITEAAQYYKIYHSQITACCQGKVKSGGKLNKVPLKWMYLSDFEKFSQEEQEKMLSNIKEE